SRRRHTRWPRDWSSDVCSSDLTPWVPSLDGGLTPFATLNNPFPTGINSPPQRNPVYQQTLLGLAVSSTVPGNRHAYTEQFNFSRSEERRVGKESRSRRGR